MQDDLAGAWVAASTQVQTALDDPEIATTAFDSPFFGLTTFEAGVGRFICFDLVAHRWDLATAAGLGAVIDPEDADPQTRMLALPARVDRVLDLGCGDGRLASLVLESGSATTEAVGLATHRR